MADALHGLAALCLSLLTVARVQMVRGSVTARSLWLALAVLGSVQWLQIEVVYRSVERDLGRAGSAALLAHGLTVGAAAATRELNSSLDPDRVPAATWRHLRWAGVTLTAMVGVYVAVPPTAVPSALLNRSEYYDGTWPTALTWAVYLAYLAWSLAGIFGATRRFARQAPSGPLCTGLHVGAAGVGVGFCYVALKLAVVAAWLSGVGPSVMRFDAAAEASVLSCSLLLIGTGSAYEVICAQVSAFRGTTARRRSLRRLRRLALVLQQASPGVSYNLPVDGDQQRLILRVIEIRDAQRGLRGFTDPTVLPEASEAARAAGCDANRIDVLAEAAALELARRAKVRGERPRPSVLREPAGGGDLAEEVRCLERLAAAYDHPFVRDFVLRHEDGLASQAS